MRGEPPEIPLLSAALLCRCPRCGRGKLYQGLLTVRAACPVCGLDLSSEDAGDGATVFVILILGALVVGLAFWLDAAFEPPLWVHIVLWTPFTFGAAILLLRPLKAGLIAQQYRLRRLADGHGEG